MVIKNSPNFSKLIQVNDDSFSNGLRFMTTAIEQL